MKNLTIESAKQFLKDNGYFVENLWSIHDVKNDYECTDEEAQNLLNEVLDSERIKQEINESIDLTASMWNMPKKSKYFLISGYWKDTNENFKNYIVKELHDVKEDEDNKLFLHGLDEETLNQLINEGRYSAFDFVVLSYEETTLN